MRIPLSSALVAASFFINASIASPLAGRAVHYQELEDRANRNAPVPVALITSISTIYNNAAPTPTTVVVAENTSVDSTPTSTSVQTSFSTRPKAARPRTTKISSSSVPSSVSSEDVTTSTSSTSPSSSSAAPAARPSIDLDSYFIGANSYYLHTIRDRDRNAILDAMQSVGMKTVRIFITAVMQNNKGSDNPRVQDVEPDEPGQYDDTQLLLVDQLMVDCQKRDMKLIIALGDRYALGFWDTNSYAYKYGIVSGGSGAQQVSDASNFYTNNEAKTFYDARIRYILNHKNALLGNKRWAELDEVVYSYEPQNEPMGHMSFYAQWTCDRAGQIKENLPSNSPILIGTGGGITIQTSLSDWAFTCDAFDIVSVHDYGTDAYSSVSALKAGIARGKPLGKRVEFQEWGASGGNKANVISAFVSAMRDAGISNMIWEIVKPGKGSSDFEIWTDEGAWNAFGSAYSRSKRTVDYSLLESAYPKNASEPIARSLEQRKPMVKKYVASGHRMMLRKSI